MSELQIGDRVQTGKHINVKKIDDSTNRLMYLSVTMYEIQVQDFLFHYKYTRLNDEKIEKLPTHDRVYFSDLSHFASVSSSGTVKYSAVKAFLKKQPKMVAEYKSIATVNETLTLSGNHLVYARKVVDDQCNPM